MLPSSTRGALLARAALNVQVAALSKEALESKESSDKGVAGLVGLGDAIAHPRDARVSSLLQVHSQVLGA
jgi:hypothetical protein